jgi:hypothetical protein
MKSLRHNFRKEKLTKEYIEKIENAYIISKVNQVKNEQLKNKPNNHEEGDDHFKNNEQ